MTSSRGRTRTWWTPIEVALLGSRRDGAERIEPLAKMWGSDDNVVIGTYAMVLARNPDASAQASGPWPVLDVGLDVDDSALLTTPAGTKAQRFGGKAHDPVLLLPRPARPLWTARVTEDLVVADGRPGQHALKLVGVPAGETGGDPGAVLGKIGPRQIGHLPHRLDQPRIVL